MKKNKFRTHFFVIVMAHAAAAETDTYGPFLAKAKIYNNITTEQFP